MIRFLRNVLLSTLPALVVLFVLLEVFFRIGIPALRAPRACFDEKERIFKFCRGAGEGTATYGRLAQQRGH